MEVQVLEQVQVQVQVQAQVQVLAPMQFRASSLESRVRRVGHMLAPGQMIRWSPSTGPEMSVGTAGAQGASRMACVKVRERAKMV